MNNNKMCGHSRLNSMVTWEGSRIQGSERASFFVYMYISYFDITPAVSQMIWQNVHLLITRIPMVAS